MYTSEYTRNGNECKKKHQSVPPAPAIAPVMERMIGAEEADAPRKSLAGIGGARENTMSPPPMYAD
jgi:hypothetical protein